MKPCIKNIIRFDYLTKLLSMIAVVSILLLIAIIAVNEFSVLVIILPVVILLVVIIVYRSLKLQKELLRIKDNKVVGTITNTMKNNGNFYISFNYLFNGETYKKRVGLLIGPLLKIKLSKMETLNLVVDNENPKKVYIADLYYK